MKKKEQSSGDEQKGGTRWNRIMTRWARTLTSEEQEKKLAREVGRKPLPPRAHRQQAREKEPQPGKEHQQELPAISPLWRKDAQIAWHQSTYTEHKTPYSPHGKPDNRTYFDKIYGTRSDD